MGVESQPRSNGDARLRNFSGALASAFAAIVTVLIAISLPGCAGITGSTTSHNQTGAGFLSPSLSSVSFGDVSIGNTSTQSFNILNSGSTDVNISQATLTGAGFTVVGALPSGSIPAGQSSAVQLQFKPQSAGAVSGSLTIVSDASNSPLALPLSGTGLQAGLSANPSSAALGDVVTGHSNSATITLTNGGNASVTISQDTVSGSGFSTSGLTVPTTIGAGKNTSFSVVFAPTTTGSVNGSLSLTSNAPNSPLTIALSGTGATASYLLSANPSPLNFGNVTVNTNDPLGVKLTNNGNSNVTISAVTLAGTGFSASGVSNGTILTPNQSATVTVTFDPTALQAYSGTLTVTSNATNSPATVALAGTGSTAPPVSASNPTCGTSASIGASGDDPAAMISGDTTGHAPPDYTSFLPGAQGTTWTDQQFGCVITRVTDAVNDGNSSSQSEHHYYIPSALNQNDDRVLVVDEGGSVYVTDLSAHKIVRGGLTGYNATSNGASVYWGRASNEAYTLYWKADDGTHNVLRKADTSSCTASSPCSSLNVTTVYTSTCPAGSFNGGNEDDMRVNIQTGNEFVGWDCTSGGNLQLGVLNVTTATLGTMKAYSGNAGFDSYKIVSQPTPSTDMFICWTNGNTGSYGPGNYNTGFWCYAGATMSNEVQVTSNGQHGNTVYDPAVNKSYLVMEQSGNDPTKNPCTSSNIASGWEEMELGNSANPHVCLLTFPSWATETHVSGGDHGLASLEIYQDAGTSPQILNANDSLDANYASDWLPLIGEVILLNTSNKTVYRVADHRSRMNACGGGSGTQNYWAVPRSSLSIDNKYVVFDSNMTRDGAPQPACNSINNFTDVYMIAIHP
jgi:archaellum component FlaF (FlaF/FlaG flagellin family)